LARILFMVALGVLSLLSLSLAGERIPLYCAGDKDQASWSFLKRYFDGKGYSVSIYEKTDNLEKHLENANRINKAGASLMLVMDFRMGEKDEVFAAITNAKKVKNKILAIDEIPAQYIDLSAEVAGCIATPFRRTVKELPLFPLLGVDMPALFLRIECTKEKAEATLDVVNDCLQKYFQRGKKDEG
jgi:hypothetical protein